MNLETFLHDLHFDPDKSRSADWEVDWDDAPLSYKLYRGLPVVPLSTEIPLSLEGMETHISPSLREIGHFLWYVYGITQVCQTVYKTSKEQTVGLTQTYRRFLPSGGALYPNECYVYLNIEDLPAGIYHYNVAHHSLVLLREGNFNSYLDQALGNRCEISTCFGAVFVSTIFWKNFFKYNNFSYRLQGLDAGVMIGQLLEVAKRFGFESGVYFQFLDQAVNHLLGISETEESVYAVIPLSTNPKTNWFASGIKGDRGVFASDLCQELDTVQHEHYLRSKRVREYPILTQMNEASMLATTQSFYQMEMRKHAHREGQVIPLPYCNQLSYDLATVCRQRYSPGADFVLNEIGQRQLATLLQEATAAFSYRNDLDGTGEKPEPRVSAVCCLYNVEGIPDGAYSYDSIAHVLLMKQIGDHRNFLQKRMTHHNINLFQAPICLHIVGEQDYSKKALGYRGYRIQQMEAGMLVQRFLLVASAIGLGGHPLLGFDANSCDQLYKLATQRETCLIQIPMGPYQVRSRLEGSLHG